MALRSSSHTRGVGLDGRTGAVSSSSRPAPVGSTAYGREHVAHSANTPGSTCRKQTAGKPVSQSQRFYDACKFGNINVVRIMLKEISANMGINVGAVSS